MQGSEHPPINNSQDQVPEGTDIDAIVKEAQDARRMQEAFGVQPDKPVTDTQLNRLQEFQGAMDVHGGRIADRAEAEHWGENNFIESDKPVDPAQAEVVQQSDDMEELSKLFGETSDKEHQKAAWKLFDEFVDKHSLSREEERARRNYLLGVSREAPAVSEAQPEPTPEPTPESTTKPTPETPTEGTETSTPTETETPAEPTPEGTPEPASTEGSEASPDGSTEPSSNGENGGESTPEGTATPSEGATTETEPTAEGDAGAEGGESDPDWVFGTGNVAGSDSSDNPNNDAEKGSAIPFGGVEGSDLSDSEYPVESTGEAIDFQGTKSPEATENEETDKGFTEKLKGMWARVKSAPVAVAASIESYFVAGTPEQNAKNRNVALAAGVVAIAGCIAIEIVGGKGSTHQVSGNIIQGMGGAFQPIASHSSGPDVLHAVAEHSHSSVEGLKTIQSHLGTGGDTIWSHAHEALRQYGAKVSNHNIFKLTSDILKDNHLTWESARHLSDGFKFTINPPAWVK